MTTELPNHGDIIYLELGWPTTKAKLKRNLFQYYFFTFVVDGPFISVPSGFRKQGLDSSYVALLY